LDLKKVEAADQVVEVVNTTPESLAEAIKRLEEEQRSGR
jgi:hypothetical protein